MIANDEYLARDLRRWLLRQPRPTKVLVHRNGNAQEVRIDGLEWARVAETIAALAPDLIEAFDDGGKLARVLRARRAPAPAPPAPAPPAPAPPAPAPPAPARPKRKNAKPAKRCPLCNAPLVDLLLLTEVAELTRATHSTVRHWVQTGKLASVKVGRRRLVPRKDFEAFLRREGD